MTAAAGKVLVQETLFLLSLLVVLASVFRSVISIILAQTRMLSLSLFLPRSVPPSPDLLHDKQRYYLYYYDTSTLARVLLVLPGVVP